MSMECPVCRQPIECVGIKNEPGDGRIYRCACGELPSWSFRVIPIPPGAGDTIDMAFHRGVDSGDFQDNIYGFALFIECLCADYLAGA